MIGVADDDVARLRDRLQPRRQIRLGPDDGVVHPIAAAEVADVAEAGIDAHAHAERVFDPFVAPFGIELHDAALHVDRHAHAGSRILGLALGFRVAEEDGDGIADVFVDCPAKLKSDLRHLSQIVIEKLCQVF